MNEQIMSYLGTNLLDSTTQHAYRRGSSCTTAWIELDTFIQTHRNSNKVIVIGLTDQSAAFNVLQRDVLLGKLEILGFSNSARQLIGDYLTGRRTKCSVNGITSGLIELSSGVGEGSVLGPCLYTLGQICVSVVLDIVREKFHEQLQKQADALSVEYADDVTGAAAVDNDDEAQIITDLMMSQYKDYFSACGLCLNPDKCSVMIIRTKAKTREIQWNGKSEERKVKLLGVYLDSRYEFIDHASHLVKVCSYKLSAIRKVARWLNDKNLLDVVRSFVISHIIYCSEIYLRLKKVRIKVQKILNAASRVALRRDRYANCEVMMRDLNWLNLHNLYRYQLVVSLRRILGNYKAYTTVYSLDWQSRASSRKRAIKTTWKKANKHGTECYIQAAITAWNEMLLGEKVFKNDEEFKDWCHKKIQSLHGNKNI